MQYRRRICYTDLEPISPDEEMYNCQHDSKVVGMIRTTTRLYTHLILVQLTSLTAFWAYPRSREASDFRLRFATNAFASSRNSYAYNRQSWRNDWISTTTSYCIDQRLAALLCLLSFLMLYSYGKVSVWERESERRCLIMYLIWMWLTLPRVYSEPHLRYFLLVQLLILAVKAKRLHTTFDIFWTAPLRQRLCQAPKRIVWLMLIDSTQSS